LIDVMICPEVGQVALFDVRQLKVCLAAGVAGVKSHQAELVRLRARAMRKTGKRGAKSGVAPLRTIAP
jgi:hypothetical protein